MEEIKDDRYFISKILDEIGLVCLYSEGMSIDDLKSKPAILDGIIFRLVQVAEHAEKISTAFKESHKEISWRNLKGFRNKLVHDYGSVDINFVYKAIKVDAPTLRVLLLQAMNN